MKLLASIFFNLKQACSYKFNQLMKIISSIIFLYINYYMVQEVLSNSVITSDKSIYLSYSVLITIISQFLGQDTENYIGKKIVSGDIAFDLLKPIGIIYQLFSVYLSGVVSIFVFSAFPLLVSSKVTLGINLLHQLQGVSGYFFVSLTISLVMMFIVEVLIGFLAFWIMQGFGLSLLKTSLINIFAGVTIPLDFYPPILKNVAINLPFQAIYCAPVNIFLRNKPQASIIYNLLCSVCGGCTAIQIVVIEQLIWTCILGLLLCIVWNFAKWHFYIDGG